MVPEYSLPFITNQSLINFIRPFCSFYSNDIKIKAFDFLDALNNNPQQFRKQGKVILITADTPLQASRGEGKTTATIALTDALRSRGIDAVAVLRQPSMGITAAGTKGGASGGGEASLQDSALADFGLFGEMSRIGEAQNLIVAHAEQAFEKGLLDTITIPRVFEIPSRALRHITVFSSTQRSTEEQGVLTPTCEMMQILTLSRSKHDIQNAIDHMTVGEYQGKPVLAQELLDSQNVMKILGDSCDPMLLKTKAGSPVYMHCGPFANVSLGIPSILSIQLACALHDVVLVEAGYGADAGAEKYLDIAVRGYQAPMPQAAVVVSRATTWLDNPKLQWRYTFNISQLEKNSIPCIPLINLWQGEEQLESTLRNYAYATGLREPLIGDLYTHGGEILTNQIDSLLSLLDQEKISHHAIHFKTLAEKIENLILTSYGVPKERIQYQTSFKESYSHVCSLLKDLHYEDINSLCINAIKSPSTITDNDELEADQRTVTLKKIRLYTGANLLSINLTTSLTTLMPKIAD